MADFILNEAFEESDDYKLVFSDDSNDEYLEEEEQHQDFICDDSLDEQQDASFYREVNFCMQITNPVELINECDDEYCGDDDLSERFDPENRQDVEFNVFEKSSTLSKKFKESLVGFKNANNQFFYGVLYGVLHHKNNGQNIIFENAEQTLGSEFLSELKSIEKSTMLNHSVFEYYEPSVLINNVFSEYGFFYGFMRDGKSLGISSDEILKKKIR